MHLTELEFKAKWHGYVHFDRTIYYKTELLLVPC
jgi:hypothetical protein